MADDDGGDGFNVQDQMEQLSDSILPGILKEEKAPMVVVPYAKWRDVGHFPRSSDGVTRPAIKSNTRHPGTEDDWVMFVSHRWWQPSKGLPDDEDDSKYKIVNRALDFLIPLYDVDPEKVVIWCDYACIDQDDRDLQSKGIASLISVSKGGKPIHPPPTAHCPHPARHTHAPQN